MHFTADINAREDQLWDLILNHLDPSVLKDVSSATSSFFRTADGLECSVRKKNGELIAQCYSESDRNGKRRWSCELI
tara:strand:+ start:217 stop:447 length:231 start_codon:yes stop_codon:yes gene_type:complete